MESENIVQVSNKFELYSSGVEINAASILGRDADLVVMVDCQIPSDDLIVHFFWFWKADCPSGKALKVSPQIQVMTLYSLGIFLADYMAGWVQQRPVYRPRIGHVEGNIKFAQQCQKPL